MAAGNIHRRSSKLNARQSFTTLDDALILVHGTLTDYQDDYADFLRQFDDEGIFYSARLKMIFGGENIYHPDVMLVGLMLNASQYLVDRFIDENPCIAQKSCCACFALRSSAVGSDSIKGVVEKEIERLKSLPAAIAKLEEQLSGETEGEVGDATLLARGRVRGMRKDLQHCEQRIFMAAVQLLAIMQFWEAGEREDGKARYTIISPNTFKDFLQEKFDSKFVTEVSAAVAKIDIPSGFAPKNISHGGQAELTRV